MRTKQTFQVDLDELLDLEAKWFSKDQIIKKQVKDHSVSGESHYQQALQQLAVGIGYLPDGRLEDSFLVLALRREPQNRYDPNAIAVYAGPLVVGYIPRRAAETLAPQLDAEGGTSWAGGRLVTDRRVANAMIGVRYWLERVPRSAAADPAGG